MRNTILAFALLLCACMAVAQRGEPLKLIAVVNGEYRLQMGNVAITAACRRAEVWNESKNNFEQLGSQGCEFFLEPGYAVPFWQPRTDGVGYTISAGWIVIDSFYGNRLLREEAYHVCDMQTGGTYGPPPTHEPCR